MKKLILLLLISLAAPKLALAIATAEGTAVGTTGTATTTLSVSHDAGSSGTNCICIFCISWNGTTDTVSAHATDPNYGGQTLQLLNFNNASASGMNIAIWYLMSPPRGSNTAQVNFSASTNAAFVVQTYCGVHQSGPLGFRRVNAAGTTNPITATVTSSIAGDLVVDCISNRGDKSATKDASQTLQASVVGGATSADRQAGMSSETAVGANTVMSWTFTPAGNWNIMTMALEAAPAIVDMGTFGGAAQ